MEAVVVLAMAMTLHDIVVNSSSKAAVVQAVSMKHSLCSTSNR